MDRLHNRYFTSRTSKFGLLLTLLLSVFSFSGLVLPQNTLPVTPKTELIFEPRRRKRTLLYTAIFRFASRKLLDVPVITFQCLIKLHDVLTALLISLNFDLLPKRILHPIKISPQSSEKEHFVIYQK